MNFSVRAVAIYTIEAVTKATGIKYTSLVLDDFNIDFICLSFRKEERELQSHFPIRKQNWRLFFDVRNDKKNNVFHINE